MTPTPQEPQKLSDPDGVPDSGLTDESIVIAGMSGLFPQSHNVKEFSDILYNKINPVTSTSNAWRWVHPESSPYIGVVPELQRFDSRFFMVHAHLAHRMDPMARKALEQAFQAIYDAGVSPRHLKGKKVGVYVAAALSDTEREGYIDKSAVTGFSIAAQSKSMYANRISYWLDSKGPSMTIDDACCGFTVALEQAFNAMRQGVCESAIVAGASICLLPQNLVHYSRCIKISSDKMTKSFDQNANGCTRSGALCVVFLQKAKDALRAYAELVHVKNAFVSRLWTESGQVYGFLRDPNDTSKFIKEFYVEAGIRPQIVEYVEAFGSATPEADKNELQAIEKLFCENRDNPLFVGSVISNIGYTESASGGAALTKVLLGYHNELLAGNLHCDTPRQDVAALREGRMRIVTEHLPFRGSFAAINCLSVMGVNSHVLLRGCAKAKDKDQYKASIPRLVNVSARLKEHVESVFEDLKSRPIDPEELALFHNIHSTNISGHLGRGYIILDTNEKRETVSLFEDMQHSDDSQRPLWFVYSGMGSQWTGMGKDLMRIPLFAASIQRCHKVLQPKGIDLVHILTSSDITIFDNILHSFVGIAAIQIALTDILLAMELRPDYIIGHSVGELGCAYADGCLTLEEAILSAYNRGKVSVETAFIRGAMAAVGLGYKQISKNCPAEIDIACHNSASSCTISGPEHIVDVFVAGLKAREVFAKIVNTSNIAYHSRYIASAGPRLQSLLSEIIRSPRARSPRWLSTSVPPERWHEPIAEYCSAEYLTNNLLSSVYFEETCLSIPSNAVLVEIAPHSLLQAILTRSLPKSCTNIPLTKGGHEDNALFFLEAIGKLYITGCTPHVNAMYPKVEFPIARGTPHLAHQVKWDHTETWNIAHEDFDANEKTSIWNFVVTMHDDDHRYLKGHKINGRILYPFAAALVAVWDTLAMTMGLAKKTVSVKFNDIHLYTQPILGTEISKEFTVSLHKGTGLFEVLNRKSKIATGYIVMTNLLRNTTPNYSEKNFCITSEEIYEYFGNKGYCYRDEFRSIHSVDESLSIARLHLNNNWVTLIDGLIQLNTLRNTYDGASQPTYIRALSINVEEHLQHIQDGASHINVQIDDTFDNTRCEGVNIQNIRFRNIPHLTRQVLALMPSSENINIRKDKISKFKSTALVIGNVGDLSTLHWEEMPIVSENDIEVKVEYAGISVTDVNRAMQANDPRAEIEKYYGMEFSGISKTGDRVMGLLRQGAACSVVCAVSELLWPVPPYWSLEEAATVPLAYIQAYYCLRIKYNLRAGSCVLIHGGAGALGQAAISIALAHGCQVFTTVADTKKKRFLLKLFPQLDENKIGNSRDSSFGDMVLCATNGEGCDIVLSCVKGSLKNISLNCSALFGETIDTEQLHNRDKYQYGMYHMTKSRSYIAIGFDAIFDPENSALRRKLQLLLSEGIGVGEVRPLSRVTYSAREAPRAFRLLAASRHRGRVLLRLQHSHDALDTTLLSPKNHNLIVWDGSAFGLQLADRLISRGVKELRILCMSSPNKLNLKLRLWEKLGIEVQLLPHSWDSQAVFETIYEPDNVRQIEGIFIVATENSTNKTVVSRFIDYLDSASRKLCPHLKYFAVITHDSNIAEKASISRSKDGHPVTALILPAGARPEEDFCLRDESTWNRYAVDVTEAAMCRDIPLQMARLQPAHKSLSKLIPALSSNDNGDSTLENLGLYEFLPLIKSYLNDVHQIQFEDEYLLNRTKKEILEIEADLSEPSQKDVKGLNIFFNYVEPDEILANVCFIPINTLAHQVKSMEDSIDENRTYLFVIPGLEGQHTRFRTLCQHLKVPAVVLQPSLDFCAETPSQLGVRYSEILLQKFKLKKNFYLLTYECGIFATLELVAILEDNDLTGTVYVIGDGPEETRALLEEELSSFRSKEELQAGVVRHMSALLAAGAAAPAAAGGGGGWEARVDASVRALRGRVPHSAQYMRALMRAAYARVRAVRQHRAAPRALRSQLVLLRARRPQQQPSGACSLQQHSRRALRVHDLAASMAHAVDDLRAPAIVNSTLDALILDSYHKMNLCQTYKYII